MGIGEEKLKILEVEDHDNAAIEISKHVLFDFGGHVGDKGKHIVIWKQEVGQWKLQWDIFNTSMPPRKGKAEQSPCRQWGTPKNRNGQNQDSDPKKRGEGLRR